MQKELFRALEINPNGGENWIVSDSIKWYGDSLWLRRDDDVWCQCYPSTRSVSYPNMIDKNGKKIFASLSEDGVGGDEFNFNSKDCGYICIFYNGAICWMTSSDKYSPCPITWVGDYGSGVEEIDYEYLEITGIYKGVQNASSK